MSDFTVGIRLTADGKDLVGAVRESASEIDKLREKTGQAASQAANLNAQQKGLTDAWAAQTSAMARASDEVQKVLARYDPLGAKLRSLRSDFAVLNEAAKSGAFGQALDPVVDLSYKKINEEIARTKGLMVQAGAAGAEGFGMMSSGAIASSFATAQARRELIVLGHEAMTGNFSRMPGSFMVLAERIGISGGAMTTVLVPLAAIGVAAVTLIKAFSDGAREMHEMNNALAMTSNFAGMTRGTMRELAQSVSDAGTLTIGTSKQIVTQLVASGQLGAQSIGAVAKLADDYANATGRDIDKITPELIKMFEDPARGAETLNKSMHALSPAFLEQIAHLERIGELDEAQRLTAEKLSSLLPKHIDQLGYLDRAWDATKKAASSAWDAMLGLGRPQTVEEALAEAQRGVDRQRTRLNYSPNRAAANMQAAQAVSYDAAIMVNEVQAEAWQKGQNARDNQLQNSIALVAKQGSEYARIRDLQDEIVKLGKSKITDDNLAVDVARKIANDQREILNIYRSIGAETRALSDGQIADATKLFEIQNKQAAEEADSQLKLGAITRQQHDQEIYNLNIADILRKKSDAEQMLAINGRTALEKQALNDRIKDLNAEAIARTQAYNNQGLIAQNALLAAQAAADATASQATTDTQLKAIAGYQAENDKLREHNAEIGKTKEQIDLLKAAEIDRDINRLNTDIAIALADGNNSEAAQHYVALLEEQIKRLKEKQGLLRSGAVLEASAANAREAKRLNEEIGRGLTDALMRGFEAGKGFAENFRDSLVNMFKTLVLRPVIQWVLSPISGAITATLGSLGIPGLANAAGMSGLGGIGGFNPLSFLGGSQTLADFGNFFGSIGSITESGSTFGLFDAISGFAAANPWTAAAAAALAIFGGSKLFGGGGGGPASNTGQDFQGTLSRAGGLQGSIFSNSANSDTAFRWFYGDFASTFGDRLPALNKQIDALFTEVTRVGEVLGADASRLANFSANVSFGRFGAGGNITLEQGAAQALAQAGEQMIRQLMPHIDQFAQAGETLTQTFTRLAEATKQLTAAEQQRSNTLAGMARALPGQLGITGLESARNALAISEFHSPTERFASARELLDQSFGRAMGGDLAAVQQFPQLLQSALTIGRDVFASGPEFQELFREGNRQLQDVLGRQQTIQTEIMADLPVTIIEQSRDQIAELRKGFKDTVAALTAVQDELRRMRAAA